MKGNKILILTLIFGFLASGSILAQGSTCSDIEPFCAGSERLTFPNSNYTNSSQISGEAGPDYGCLEEQPYPAWFFLQVEDSGDLSFKISQYENEDGSGAPLDVDFVVWGPFERGEEYCSATALNAENLVDCSYLPDAVETMTISGAMANQVYVVVITNFQQLPGFISLEQTNSGGGSTDCSILDSDLGDNIVVCGENEYILDGTTDEAEIYEWYVYNESTSQYEQIPGEDGPTLTVTQSGDYRLVVKDLVGASSDQDDVTVTFYEVPEIGEVSGLSACAESTEFIDLTEASSQLIAPNSNPADYRAIFYESTDAIENNEPIIQPSSFPFQDGTTIYAKVEYIESGCLSEVEQFDLVDFNFPEYQLAETTVFCVDRNNELIAPVSLGNDLGSDYTYEWTDGTGIIGTSAVLTLNDLPSGNQLSLTLRHSASGCEKEFITMPVAISRPESVSISISGSDFGDGYTVTATAENVIGGTYAGFEYKLDNSNWQESNVFNRVPPGSHTITTREINGCGETTSDNFFLVGYPRFFTPNSDGYNDTWSLISNSDISIKRLFVFDRYGKLIRQLDPGGNKGWDGTYNGKDLPADDYWFRVEFVDQKTGGYQVYMSNFTLKR
ncbi:T9SS type B sorting domain-containing protein [Gramella jeungdoensis]|uniref:T9SS type B sorting domain-containing protein n=1 Tax=Gramella jeungdoensis TaxID=708091 RepID=A0ABT0YWR9_9FLAO|nr:T9SS type B sorting domain-containing protein [Gramella jeungdoensis]MCM8567901.1 T9SS type B sorting domain-containing protein [Gramella jeungdoensis]